MKTIWTAILLLCAAVLPAQTVQWGPKYADAGYRVALEEVVSFRPDNLIIFRSRLGYSRRNPYKNPQLVSFNKNLEKQEGVDLEPMAEGNALRIESVLEIRDRLWVFASWQASKGEPMDMYVAEVDRGSLKLKSSPQLIADIKPVSKRTRGIFDVVTSPDKSHVLVYANPYSGKKENEHYVLHVFDAEMTTVWSKEVTLPFAERNFAVQRFVVDNEGDVYMLGNKIENKRANLREGPADYEFVILGYNDQGATVKEYPLTIGDRFITDITIDVAPDNEIVCAGFYSDEKNFSIDGSFYVRIEKETQSMTKISTKEFGLDFMTQNMTAKAERRTLKRAARGKNIQFYNYDLRDMVPRGDGGTVLVAEQYYYQVVCTTDPKTRVTTCTTHYYYNDILVVSTGPEGDIEWNALIPKRQHSVNDGGYYSSYALMVTADNLHFIYNDHDYNLSPKKPGKYKNFAVKGKHAVVMDAMITPDGTLTRKPIFNTRDQRCITRPKMSSQISLTDMVLFARAKGGTQVGILSF